MRFLKVVSLFAAILWLLPTAAVPLSAHPNIPISRSISSNWAGYVGATDNNNPANNAVSDVKGTWIVPAVKCTLTLTDVANWVGIDGGYSNSVEQIGTDSSCFGGRPTYYSWYEMFPAGQVSIDKVPVNPGDSISTEVHYDGNASDGSGNLLFTLSIKNNTTGKSFSAKKVPIKQDIANQIALRNSAEWIIEASFAANVLPLADFGTTGMTGASETINGVTGPISRFAYEKDDMGSRSTGRLKAQTSALTNGGTAFTVTWVSSQ